MTTSVKKVNLHIFIEDVELSQDKIDDLLKRIADICFEADNGCFVTSTQEECKT
jgi:hypothetical protein